MTKTAKNKGAKREKQATNSPQSLGCRYEGSEEIDVLCIDPSPFQPRQEIRDEDLLTFAGTMQRVGFLDAIWVRRKDDGRFELLDGERRWRAARIAQLATIRADVFECSDAQARSLGLLSVIHREDLGPIERATAFEKMLQAGDFASQGELAIAMGLEQATVSNLIRLLKLPAAWQRRIISREISERHARAMLPYTKYPGIIAAFDAWFAENLDADGALGMPSVAEWESDGVPSIVKSATRSMEGLHGDRHYYHPRYGRVSIFEPTVIEEKQLKIIRIGDEPWATNVELWEQLQQKHLEEQAAQRRIVHRDNDLDSAADDPEPAEASEAEADDDAEASTAAQSDYRGDGEDAEADDHRGATPKASSAADADRNGVDNGNALRHWLLGWAQWLIADEVCTRSAPQTLLALHLLGFYSWGLELSESELDEATNSELGLNRKKSLTERLLACGMFEMEKIAGRLAAAWFYDANRGPLFLLDAKSIYQVCEALEISLADEFQGGRLLAPYGLLEAMPDAVVTRWANVWKAEIPINATREQGFAAIEETLKDGRAMPREMLAAWKAIGKE